MTNTFPPQTNDRDTYGLFAVTTDKTKVAIKTGLFWDTAQTEWLKLDDARLKRNQNVLVDGMLVAFLVVRSDFDPEWSDAPGVREVTITKAINRVKGQRPAYVRALEARAESAEAERDALRLGLEALRAYAQLPKFADGPDERYTHPYMHREDVLLRVNEALTAGLEAGGR